MKSCAVESFRDLVVWQRAMETCVAVYRLTSDFPRREAYGLTSQLRRAGISIPSNIAEGYGRLSREQYKHFLGIASGSNLELQTQLAIAGRLGFAASEEIDSVEALSIEVGKMLGSIIRKL